LLEIFNFLEHSKKKMHLTTNMGVQLQNDPKAAIFSRHLLEVSNGTVPKNPETRKITFPSNFCNIINSKEELVDKVFQSIEINYQNHAWLSGRTILAAKNVDVHDMNNIIINRTLGETVRYKSIDSVMDQSEGVKFPTEFFNSLDVLGLPSHILNLKIGVPIIFNQPKLCNGTRLVVNKLMTDLIEATILIELHKSEDVLLP